MLNLWIGAAILLYAWSYFRTRQERWRATWMISGFVACTWQWSQADRVIPWITFWELTSLFSFLLIGFGGKTVRAREAAGQAWVVTFVGTLCLLLAMLWLSRKIGSDSISVWMSRAPDIARGFETDPDAPAIAALFLIGCLTKSAQFPFHFWLPAAMAAPTPVSALLHSATLVVMGVVTAIQFHPLFGELSLWRGLLLGCGALTLFRGGIGSIRSDDAKQALAYSTLTALGLMTFLAGLGTPESLHAATLLVSVHAIYKAVLFLVVGNIEQTFKSRELPRLYSLGALGAVMPGTALAATLAGLCAMGVPPSAGYALKEALVQAMGPEWITGMVPWVGLVFSTWFLLRLVWGVFWAGKFRTGVHDARWPMVFAAIALSLTAWLAGITAIESEVKSPAHGTFQFQWSMSIWMVGLFCFAMDRVLFERTGGSVENGKAAEVENASIGAGVFRRGLVWIEKTAHRWTWRWFQTGFVPAVAWPLVVGLCVVLAALWLRRGVADVWHVETILSRQGGYLATSMLWISAWSVLLGVMISPRARGAAKDREPMTWILALGLLGLGVASFYAVMGAGDLSLTQICVETLSVFFFVTLMGAFLGKRSLDARMPFEIPTWVFWLSVSWGGALALVTWAASNLHVPSRLSSYFIEKTPEAHGSNVVNVVLVDFRGFDTLGEISVLAIALLCVWGIARKKVRVFMTPKGHHDDQFFLKKAVLLLTPLLLGTVVWVFWRGHHHAGGGFVAGLILSATVFWLPPKSVVFPIAIACVGLALALGTVLYSGATTGIPMKGVWNGGIGTPVVFDAGVLLLVTGCVLFALSAVDPGRRR